MDLNIHDARFSYASIAFGALGIFLALFTLYAGPFTPQPDVGTSIGEIAGNMRAAAQRALQGLPQPEATIVEPSWDIDRILMATAPALGVLGLVSGLVGYIRKEPRRAATSGIAVSVFAVLVHVFLIAVLMIAGAILLVGIMKNMDSILGS